MWFVMLAIGLSGILLGLFLGLWLGILAVSTYVEKSFDKGFYEHNGKLYTITKMDTPVILSTKENLNAISTNTN